MVTSNHQMICDPHKTKKTQKSGTSMFEKFSKHRGLDHALQLVLAFLLSAPWVGHWAW